MERFRFKNEEFFEQIYQEAMRWLTTESIQDDKEFYHFLTFFFSKIHAIDQFHKMTSMIDE